MLEKYNLSPSRLILEVTESTALKNLDRSIELLNAFNHAGITVSIDDFGTGYSNLLMLSVLPAKELKIDKSFVTSMLENEKTYKLVETIMSIARTMEMNVVAEGIETEERRRFSPVSAATTCRVTSSPAPYLPNRCRGCFCR